jgi:hypothetical protein
MKAMARRITIEAQQSMMKYMVTPGREGRFFLASASAMPSHTWIRAAAKAKEVNRFLAQ